MRRSLARIEKRARPPLSPAPIENPLTEAVTILHNFSESLNGIESKLITEEYEEEHDGGSDITQCEHCGLSQNLPSWSSPEVHGQPLAAASGGGMRRSGFLKEAPSGDTGGNRF